MDIPRRLSFITPPRILSIEQHSPASRFYRSRVHRGLIIAEMVRAVASENTLLGRVWPVEAKEPARFAFRRVAAERKERIHPDSARKRNFIGRRAKTTWYLRPAWLFHHSSSNPSNLSRRARETAEPEKSFIIPRINFPARIITEQRLLKRNGCCI